MGVTGGSQRTLLEAVGFLGRRSFEIGRTTCETDARSYRPSAGSVGHSGCLRIGHDIIGRKTDGRFSYDRPPASLVTQDRRETHCDYDRKIAPLPRSLLVAVPSCLSATSGYSSLVGRRHPLASASEWPPHERGGRTRAGRRAQARAALIVSAPLRTRRDANGSSLSMRLVAHQRPSST